MRAPIDSRGSLGDVFGIINALFSGLAFVGVVVAIAYQIRQLQLQYEQLQNQREDLAIQREDLRKSVEAQEQSAEALQERLSLEREFVRKRLALDLYNEWLSLPMQAVRSSASTALRDDDIKATAISNLHGTGRTEAFDIIKVFDFFSKCARLVELDLVSHKLIADLLGEDARGWWELHFGLKQHRYEDQKVISRLNSYENIFVSSSFVE